MTALYFSLFIFLVSIEFNLEYIFRAKYLKIPKNFIRLNMTIKDKFQISSLPLIWSYLTLKNVSHIPHSFNSENV